MYTANRKTLKSQKWRFWFKTSAHDLDHKLFFPTFPSEKLSVSYKHCLVVRRQSCLLCWPHSKYCIPWSREINNEWASHVKGQTPRLGKTHLHSPHLCMTKWTSTADPTAIWYRKVFILSFIWPSNITQRQKLTDSTKKRHHTAEGPQYRHTVQKLPSAVRVLSIKRPLHSILGLVLQRSF